MKLKNIILKMIFFFLLYLSIFAGSNEHFKLIDTLNYYSAHRPMVVLKFGNDNFFIIDKIWESNSDFIFYNYTSGTRQLLDTTIYNKYFCKYNIEITSGINVDGKLILSGRIDSALVLYENSNGIWGEWKQINLTNKTDSVKYFDSFLKCDPNNKDKIYLYCMQKNGRSEIFTSNDRGGTWTKRNINLSWSFSQYKYLIISEDLLYTTSWSDFYKINLKTNIVDTLNILPFVEKFKLCITNIIFKDKENGIIEVSGKDFVENDTLKRKILYYKTTDGGVTWNNVSEITLLGGFNSNYFYYTNDNILRAFNDNTEMIESKDFGQSWLIDNVNLKKETPWAILGYAPIIEGQKYLVISNSDIYEFNVNLNSVPELYDNEFVSNLYPNPAIEKLLLKEIPDGATSYEIYNHLGIKVSGGEISNEINVASLPTGIYFLKIGNEKPMKFVKVE